MKTKTLMLSILCAMVGTTVVAQAQDVSTTNDPWIFRFGAAAVDPKSNNGVLAGMRSDIGSSVEPSASIEYMITPDIGVDALAAAPFEHDIRLDGIKMGTVRELPPTLGVNYHFMPNAKVSPFLGVGANFTWFYSGRGTGPLQGARLSAANSVGPAAHAGVDIRLSDKWLVTADVRWVYIESDVNADGAYVGKTVVNPMVYGLSVGYRF